MRKIAEIRFWSTDQTIRAIVEARSVEAAKDAVIQKLMTMPAGTGHASFHIVGNARKADWTTLPTLSDALKS